MDAARGAVACRMGALLLPMDISMETRLIRVPLVLWCARRRAEIEASAGDRARLDIDRER